MSSFAARAAQTPAQQLYSEFCGKAKVRPDATVSEGLAAKGLTCTIDKWTVADCSVVCQLSRRLKGYTHINISYALHSSTALSTAAGTRSKRSARRSRASPQVGIFCVVFFFFLPAISLSFLMVSSGLGGALE